MQKITFELDVYSFQIDFIGHVNNAVYIHWMEIGRTKLLEAVGMPTHEIFKQGFAPVLVQTNITYKAPLHLGERVNSYLAPLSASTEKPGLLKILNRKNPNFTFINPVSEQGARCVLI